MNWMSERTKGKDRDAQPQLKALKNLGILISTRHYQATREHYGAVKALWSCEKPHTVEFGLYFASKITGWGGGW